MPSWKRLIAECGVDAQIKWGWIMGLPSLSVEQLVLKLLSSVQLIRSTNFWTAEAAEFATPTVLDVVTLADQARLSVRPLLPRLTAEASDVVSCGGFFAPSACEVALQLGWQVETRIRTASGTNDPIETPDTIGRPWLCDYSTPFDMKSTEQLHAALESIQKLGPIIPKEWLRLTALIRRELAAVIPASTDREVADEEPIDLSAACKWTSESVHYVSELLHWAKTDRKSADTDSACSRPESLIDYLVEAYNKAQDYFAPASNMLARAIVAELPAYGEVYGASYHEIGIRLGRKVLQTAADALGMTFLDGVNPEIGRYSAKIAGWREGLERIEIDNSGNAVPTGERVWIKLTETDFRQRLQAIPDFSEDELTKRIEKESALTAGGGRRDPTTVRPAEPIETPAPSPPPDALHSDDYRSVKWFGQDYCFTGNQAACVKVLWEHWERGTPDVAGPTLLDISGASRDRLDLVFRGNPAWGKMIVGGRTKGTYRLDKPRAAMVDEPSMPTAANQSRRKKSRRREKAARKRTSGAQRPSMLIVDADRLGSADAPFLESLR